MSRFLSSRFANLLPYTPGEQPQDRSYVKLNTNESPFPPSPRVLEALNSEQVRALNLYPDPQAKAFLSTLSAYYGLTPAQAMPGNGSDESLMFAFLAFCGADKGVCFADITYGFYRVYADLLGIDTKIIPLREDFTLAPEDYYSAGRTIFIANPNAPTGIALSRSQIADILARNPDDLVVIDEAYVDYGGESALPLLDQFDNLLVIRTFSKSRNLAGMRIGWAMGNEDVIADMNKMKYSLNPYNLDRLALLAGQASIEDEAYFRSRIEQTIATREAFSQELRSMGCRLLPSSANFVFVSLPGLSGQATYGKLRERGILVRYLSAQRTADFVRITIGSQQQMQLTLTAIRQIMEEKL